MSEPEKQAKLSSNEIPSNVIDSFRRRIRGVRICALEVVPKAKEVQKETVASSHAVLERCAAQLSDKNPRVQAEALTSLMRESSNTVLHHETPYDLLIVQSFLKSAFSAFDAYVGDLLRTLYRINPSLIRKIEKQVGIADLLDASTVESAKELLIEKDIESLLRESYPTQFEVLAKRFDLETLTKFPNWKKFVESSQRRNLITHREGKVNTQYLVVCRRHGVQLPSDIKVGSVLDVSLEYLCESLDVIYEVGFKLGQVLWRKASRSGNEEADTHLINGIVEILQREDWAIASSMSEFAVTCTKPQNERNKKMMQVNHAQALIWEGRKQEALDFLKQHDWTVAIRDLRLAVAVLREEFEDAAELMKQIGRKGEIVDCRGYVDWPIFREFRKTIQFREAFQEVFGVAFEDEAKKLDSASLKANIPKSRPKTASKRKGAVKKRTKKT
jgi:hypothetical protein